MSPLALSSKTEKNHKDICIASTPQTCPINKNKIIEKWENTTKCSSSLNENEDIKELFILPQNLKYPSKRSYEFEDAFPVNTIENDQDVLLIKAKKRFSFNKKNTFTIFKDDQESHSRTILQILREKSSIGSTITHDFQEY